MNRNTSILSSLILFAAAFSGASTSAIAQPQYSYMSLPVPAGTTASEPHGIATIDDGTPAPSRYMVAGRVVDAAGLSRAVVWTEANDGTWGVELLTVTNPSADSDNWDVDSFFDIIYVPLSVGSTGNPATPGGQQPAAWTCTGDPCTWTPETVVLAPGYTGGAARRVAHFKPGSTFLSKACGFLTDSSGGTKAVVWTRDAASQSWQPTLLPGLVEPDTGSSANSMAAPDSVGGTQIGWSIVGAATDAAGHRVPVRWGCDPLLNDCSLTASWTAIALPMLPGGTQGEAIAMNKAELIEAIASNLDVGGGGMTAKRGGVYTCDQGSNDCTLPSSWNVVELPPLPGYANSQAFGIKEDGVNIVAGGSSDNGPGTEVATDWIVDRSVSPPMVSVFDVNNLAVNLPSNIVLKKKGDVKDTIVILIMTNQHIQTRTAAAFVGNAAVLTENVPPIPAVAPWGLVVMTLLTLAGGSVVLTRHRAEAVGG